MSEIDRILDKDKLISTIDEMISDNPEGVIFSWYAGGDSHTYCYGPWPMSIGLAKMLQIDIEAGLKVSGE
jgi:hypothetical protein